MAKTLDLYIKNRYDRIKELILNGEILSLDDILWLMDNDPELYLEYERRMG